MTMEEAIQQLDGAEMMLLNREFIQFNQAIIMAISALRIQQEQESECLKNFATTAWRIVPNIGYTGSSSQRRRNRNEL